MTTEIVTQMLAAARRLAELGLSPGSSGNISCRVGKSLWMSASGTQFADLNEDGLVELDAATGAHIGPPRSKASKELPLHLALYRRNPQIECVIHLHSPAAAAAACLPAWREHSALAPISPYAVMRVGNLPLIGYEHPGSPLLGDRLTEVAVPFDCALLQNHGSIAGGVTVAEAMDRCIEIEQACNLRLLLGPFPEVNQLSDEQTVELAKANRRPWGDQDHRY